MVQRIPTYKLKVLDKLKESDVISKLLHYDTSDAMRKPNLTEDEKDDLIYSRIYPYRFVPDIIENQGTYITIGLGSVRLYEQGYDIYDDFTSAQLNFFIFTHQGLMRTNSGIRQDLLVAEVSKIFDKDRTLGIGELKIRSMDELWIHNNKFGGYTISFQLVDI